MWRCCEIARVMCCRETSDDFEALAGTMRAAKRRKLVDFDGELLLQGVHDNVDVILLK